MPARDRFHNLLRDALVREGWSITADPLTLTYGKRSLYVDIGAGQLLGASQQERRIVVEVKSFGGPSEIADLELALGQFMLYRAVLRQLDPESVLYLAIPYDPYVSIFEDPLGMLLIEEDGIRLIVFDSITGELVKWVG